MTPAAVEAASARMRARLGRGPATLGAADDAPAPCACAPALGFWSGVVLIGVPAAFVAFNVGSFVGAAAVAKRKR